jgi:hypothetical protein
VKELFKAALNKLTQAQVEIKPIRGLWISFWYRGKRFMYMAPKRNFFVADILHPGGDWNDRIRISTRKEWEAVFAKQISKYLEYLEENK